MAVAAAAAGPGALRSAEIYDPTVSSWTQVAFMHSGRERHAETLLPDGTVVVTGGINYGYVGSGFEIYNPVSNSWNAPDASLSSSRADHTATLLAGGKVLLAGGTDGDTTAVDTAEILDLNQGGTPTGSMITARAHHTASLLADGTVLVVGGNDGNTSLSSAEIFDPTAGTWSAAPPMASARAEHTATTLKTGDVLVVGGIDDTPSFIAAAELYTNLLPNGGACTAGGQCQSTFCAGGVCCDSACDDATCQACTVAKGATKDGTCTPLDGIVCDESPCKIAGLCFGGKCTTATPKACPPADVCHQQGTCDPGSGVCVSVAKLDGSDCDDGICIAGACVPRPLPGRGGQRDEQRRDDDRHQHLDHDPHHRHDRVGHRRHRRRGRDLGSSVERERLRGRRGRRGLRHQTHGGPAPGDDGGPAETPAKGLGSIHGRHLAPR